MLNESRIGFHSLDKIFIKNMNALGSKHQTIVK